MVVKSSSWVEGFQGVQRIQAWCSGQFFTNTGEIFDLNVEALRLSAGGLEESGLQNYHILMRPLVAYD